MSDCPGAQSESAGKSNACEGFPNQEACATAPKSPDLGSLFFFYFFTSSLKFFIFVLFCFCLCCCGGYFFFMGNGYLPILVNFRCLYTKLAYD